MPAIGSYTLHTIETGRFRLDGGAMFGIVPRTLWERRVEPDSRNRITMHMRCLLLESSDRLILIDNGLGDKFDAKFKDIYAVEQDFADLHSSLKQVGVSAEDVTDVILTHLHFDHCGGSTRRKGDRLELVFSRAMHHVQRAHWEWALRPNAREAASFLKENLEPLAQSGNLNLLDGAVEILPGIEMIVVNGHTEAQQLVKVSDDGKTLVYVADLLPTTAHLPLPWIMAYDVRPLVSMDEKQAFLDLAVAGKWSLFFEHDQAVSVADVVADGHRIAAVNERSLGEL